MTRDEILINSIWTEGKMNVYAPFFEKEVRVNLLTSYLNLKSTDKIISEKFVQAVNDFLALSSESKSLMKSLLYKHCLECCSTISYGVEILNGESEEQANLREFDVNDEDTAFEKSNLDHVTIDEEDQESDRFVRIIFYPPWEHEHGCELILKNGTLLDHYGESGGYIAHL